MKHVFTAVIVLAFSTHANSTPAIAQAAATALPCVEATGDALKTCLASHYAAIDRQAGDAYRAAIIATDAMGLSKNLVMDWKRALQEAQRKWIAFRESDCGPPVTYATSKQPAETAVVQLRCKIDHTAHRLATLTARTGKP